MSGRKSKPVVTKLVLRTGSRLPLGASAKPDGVNFAIYCKNAARVWLTRNPWAMALTLRGDAVFVARGRLPRHEPDAYRLEID